MWNPDFKEIKIIERYDGDIKVDGDVKYRGLLLMDWFRDCIINEVVHQLFDANDGYVQRISYNENNDDFKIDFKI